MVGRLASDVRGSLATRRMCLVNRRVLSKYRCGVIRLYYDGARRVIDSSRSAIVCQL